MLLSPVIKWCSNYINLTKDYFCEPILFYSLKVYLIVMISKIWAFLKRRKGLVIFEQKMSVRRIKI